MKRPVSYLVRETYLPKALLQTAKAKELLASGQAADVDSAAAAAGISRSTFYKYREGIFTFYDLGAGQIANLSLRLQDRAGVLSGVLNAVAACGANVLTINQGLPSCLEALATMSVRMGASGASLQELLEALERLEGVLEVRIDGIRRQEEKE